MWVKNGRIIINEVNLEFDVKCLEKELRKFFEEDSRFSMYDIGVFIEFDDECWNEETHYIWNEINIRIINYDKVIELGGELIGQKTFATAYITYTTEGFEPQLVMNNGIPEFYYVFNWASSTVTNSNTWKNNRDSEITVEDIIENEVLSQWEL
jgi:hypothetical protein